MGRHTRLHGEGDEEYLQRIEAAIVDMCREVAYATGAPARDVRYDYEALQRGDGEGDVEWSARLEHAADVEQAKLNDVLAEIDRREKAVDDAHDRAKASAGRIADRVASAERGSVEDIFKKETQDLLLLYEESLQVSLSKIPEDCEDRPDLPMQDRNHRRQLRLLFHRGIMDVARKRMEPHVARYLTNDSIAFRAGGYIRQMRNEDERVYIDRVAAAVRKATYDILAGYHHRRRTEVLARRDEIPEGDDHGDTQTGRLVPPRPFVSDAVPANVVGEVRSPGREGSRSASRSGGGLNEMLLSRHEELVRRGRVTSVQAYLKGGEHPVPPDADGRVVALSPVRNCGKGDVDFIDGALVKGGVEVSQGNRLNYWIGVAQNLIRHPSRSPTETEQAEMAHFEEVMGVPPELRQAERMGQQVNPLIVPGMDGGSGASQRVGSGSPVAVVPAAGAGKVPDMKGNLRADVGGAAKCHPVQMNVLTAVAEGFLARHWDLPVAQENTPKDLVEAFADKHPELFVPLSMSEHTARGAQNQVDLMMQNAVQQFSLFLESKVDITPACDDDVAHVGVGHLAREEVVHVPWETGEVAEADAPSGHGSPDRHASPFLASRHPLLAKAIPKKHLAYLDPNLVAIPHTLKRPISLQELAAQRDVSPARPDDPPPEAYLNHAPPTNARYYDGEPDDDVWSQEMKASQRPVRMHDHDMYASMKRLDTPVMETPMTDDRGMSGRPPSSQLHDVDRWGGMPPRGHTGSHMSPLPPSGGAPPPRAHTGGYHSIAPPRPAPGTSQSPSFASPLATPGPTPDEFQYPAPTAPAYLHPTAHVMHPDRVPPTTPHPSPVRLYASPQDDPPKYVRFHDSPGYPRPQRMAPPRGSPGPVGAYPFDPRHQLTADKLPLPSSPQPRNTNLTRILSSASSLVPHLHLLCAVQAIPRAPPSQPPSNAPPPRLRCDICRHDAVYMCIECNGGAFCPHCWGVRHHGDNADPSFASHRKITTPYLCALCSAKATLECRACPVKCCRACWDKVHHARSGRDAHEPSSLEPHNYLGRAEPKQYSPARGDYGKGDVTKMWMNRNPQAVRRIEQKYGRDVGALGAAAESIVQPQASQPRARPARRPGQGAPVPSPRHVKRLLGIYRVHAPELIPSMMDTLRAHHGREAQLFRDLEERFDVQPRANMPDDPPAYAGVKSPLNRGATYEPPPSTQIYAPPRAGSGGLRL